MQFCGCEKLLKILTRHNTTRCLQCAVFLLDLKNVRTITIQEKLRLQDMNQFSPDIVR